MDMLRTENLVSMHWEEQKTEDLYLILTKDGIPGNLYGRKYHESCLLRMENGLSVLNYPIGVPLA